MKNYLVRGKITEFYQGETVQVMSKDYLAVRLRMNIRAVLESPLELKLKNPIQDRLAWVSHELIFSQENLISKEKGMYTFQTKYSMSLDDVLSLKDAWLIPFSLVKSYSSEPYKKLKGIAYDLKGNRENCVDILKEFYKFAREKVRGQDTYGKSLKNIVKEIKSQGCFYGNCKEVTSLILGLCDCIGLPSRHVTGKFTADEGGHMWPEVCVPHRKSYIWMPVDAATGYFNNYVGHHITNSYIPEKQSFIKRFLDSILSIEDIKVKIEYA